MTTLSATTPVHPAKRVLPRLRHRASSQSLMQSVCGVIDGAAVAEALIPAPQRTVTTVTLAAPRRTRPLVPPEHGPLEIRHLPAWKRTMDVLGAGAALLILAPLMLLVALAVKLTSPGPVIFRQKRCGLGGEPFIMHKFRTMVCGAEALKPALLADNEQDGPVFKMRRDPRVTRLGRFLRESSLDEIPQLWNVLKGDMSLVGPRPLPCDETAAFDPSQRRRLSVTPGLTGLWQVRGRAGIPFERWVALDLQYIQTRGFWADVRILLLTVPAVLSRRGAW